MIEISTYEFSLRNGESRSFTQSTSFEERLREFTEKDSILFLLEDLNVQKEAAKMEVQAGDAPMEQLGSSSVTAIYGHLEAGIGFNLNITARAASRFKLSILRLRKKLGDSWSNFPCDTCKRIAKILARLLAGFFGFSSPSDAVDAFGDAADLDFESAFKKLISSGLWKWVKETGIEALFIALLGPLILFWTQVRTVENWVYEETCIVLGWCEPD